MQPTASTASAPPASLDVDAHPDLQRKPTWAQISFDNGFDLDLAGTSALANASATNAAPSAPSLPDASSSKVVQPSRPLEGSTPISTAPSASAPSLDANAAPSPRHKQKFTSSPVSPYKAPLQLPPVPQSTSADRHEAQVDAQTTAAPLPTSASYASTLHARSGSSRDAPLTSKPQATPPATPQQYANASPVVTLATPEQPPYPDPAHTPMARLGMQQHSRPVPSADAYTTPIETLQNENSSRPGTAGTAMSHLSGSNWNHDAPSNRSSVVTASTMPMHQMKRASVLTFQTANSAGFTSGEDARASDREHLADDSYVAGPSGASQTQPRHKRPWLDQANSGNGSSPDERSFPGGRPGSFWGEPSSKPAGASISQIVSQPSVHPNTAAAAVGEAAAPAKPSEPSALAGIPSDVATNDPAENGIARNTREMASVNVESDLAPINFQALAPASPNAPLSSTTIAAPSDETAQAMLPSPEAAKSQKLPLPVLDDEEAPPLSAKHPIRPPSGPPRNGVHANLNGEASPAPADNVIPPPLPTEAVKPQPTIATDMLLNGPADQKPVSDYRKKPLANISPAQKAAGLAHLKGQDPVKQADMEMQMPSHPPPTLPPAEAPPIPAVERARRKSSASLTAATALAQAAALPVNERVDRPRTPGEESESSRESSAPPDGEVEARAEWERRRRMKRKNAKNSRKQSGSGKPQKGRSDTFKTQLKPLQLVAADNLNSFGDRNGAPNSASNMTSRGSGDRNSVAFSNRGPTTPDGSGPQTYSTQQLQKLQAREQRRSVGAFSAAMAAANTVSSGSNGPYPVFTSPSMGPQKGGVRQYPGLMAQRSLVPPFELQYRPDGLPSAMIGPDGIRRSLNDPEVCLECMMRDEDMIDIRVVGEGVWERESDRDFEEAVRLEAEEAANGHGSTGGHSDSVGSYRDSRGSRKPRKRIGKGEPLTVERLKLHTQMNPPASSFRWRTLQTFLAVQAKYIAIERQRMRKEAKQKKRYTSDSISSRGSIIAVDPITAVQPERTLSSPLISPREASAPQRQSILQPSVDVDDTGLTPLQKQEKERDVASAQAARKKMTAAASPATLTPPMAMPVYPANVPAAGGLVSPNGTRRMPFASSQAARAARVQDLRATAEIGRSASGGLSPSPESLVPPSRSFLGASPSRSAGRSGASQLSLMHSGSMIDMHVAQENQNVHRLNQNGFLPDTPLQVESPIAVNRSYYGFPGDGDSSLPDAAAFERSRMVSSDGYVDPMEAGPRGLDREDGGKRKKKGLRGFFSKLTGSSSGPSRDNSGATSSRNGSIASREANKRSQGSGSPRMRQNSLSADRSLDTSTVGLNDMLSKARKSTSSFFRNGLEGDGDSKPRGQTSANNTMYQHPPGMASQNSLDLGPFQPASPQALGNRSGGMQQQQSNDQARMRKASNPLMQKYLQSPNPQTQASPVSSAIAVQPSSDIPVDPSFMANDSRQNRVSTYAGMQSMRPSGLQGIPDGGEGMDENDPRVSVRWSVGNASLRKELSAMPASAGDGREHQRTTSSGTGGIRSSTTDSIGSATESPGLAPVANIKGRLSMQASRPPAEFGTRPAPPAIITGDIRDDASINSKGPNRPPRNPRRPDRWLGSPSVTDLNGGIDSARAQSQRDFPSQRLNSDTYQSIGSPESAEKSGSKSRFLRLAFGRKKRESTLGDCKPSIIFSNPDGSYDASQASPPQQRSTSGGFLGLRSRRSYAGLEVPKSSFQTERQRVLSSPAHDAAPPRSQSALGMARSNRFMSMDVPRRSMNLSRSNNRLSTLGGGAGKYDDDQDDEDDDDRMGREPGYEAEFERYAQEAYEERVGAGAGREVNFGRKSLNLLRDGFKMPFGGEQKRVK